MRNHQEKNAGVDGSDKPYLLKFGSFTLDLQRHGLFRGNSRVHLTSKPFETLAVLVEHRGKTVGKQQLLDAVWKGAFVTEDSIVKAIREIRRVLEDEKSNPQFIQTVPGEGYRFIAEITRADPPEKPFDLISEDLNFKVAAEATVVPERVAGRLRVGFWVTAATLGLLTILVAVIFLRPSVDPESPHQRRISDDFPGSQTEASLSPDGNWLAFTSDHSEGIPQVWIQSMPRGKPHQLTVGDIPSHHASWSPNGGEIVFSRGADWQQDIWSISAFGGPPRILIEGGRNASWSRDGNRLVFEKDDEIWMANADGSGQHRVEGVPPNELLLVDREPSLSPDGSQIAFFQPEDGPMGDIWIIPSQGGWARQLTTDSHLGNGPVWTPDGRHILFSSQRRGSKNLWKIDESGGTPQPVTIGPGEQTDPEISRDGATLIYTNSSVHRTLTLLDPPAHRNSEIRETETDMYFPEFSPAGDKIAFFATVDEGDIQIFTIGLDGSDLKQVTQVAGERNVMPRWSADGTHLYYYRIRPHVSFRKISVEGGSSVEIAPGWTPATHYGARVDSNEKNIHYSRLEKGKAVATLIRNIATREETSLKRPLDHPRWSSDGLSIVGIDPASSGDDAHGDIVTCLVATGTCRKVASEGHFPVWSADDSRIYFDKRRSEIWSVLRDGTDEKLVVQRPQVDPISGEFDVSRQGKFVYVQFKQDKQKLWMTRVP